MSDTNSDTWSKVQAHKKRQDSLREWIQRRNKKRQDGSSTSGDKQPMTSLTTPTLDTKIETSDASKQGTSVIKTDPLLEKWILEYLCDKNLSIPIDSLQLLTIFSKGAGSGCKVLQENVNGLLEKLAVQNLISVKPGSSKDGKPCILITEVEYSKLEAIVELELKVPSASSSDFPAPVRKRKRDTVNVEPNVQDVSAVGVNKKKAQSDDIQSLLSMRTTKENESKKVGDDILDLLNIKSAKEQLIVEKFKSQGGANVQEFCEHGTREECKKNRNTGYICKKVHFRKIIQKHTDESLGDCSFLNTCFHMDTCKYVHYEVDYTGVVKEKKSEDKDKSEMAMSTIDGNIALIPPQWIQCDLRYLDFAVIGKFSVVMADPPWDIHMELPYGTMSDDEMRKLSVPNLQDEGYIFLWVTGRAMELGRECLKLWGYERCDELIWVKTNQLQRLIRTGRTGHWLNHGKEHCLVGVKGKPKDMNNGLDCDVLVAEVRSTSHKPDEIYGLIERLAPGKRKIELFGRPHNVQPNWLTLGNQLDGVRLLEPDVVERFKTKYPSGIQSLTASK